MPRFAVLLAFIVLLPVGSAAQQTPATQTYPQQTPHPRPKIGVALEGGGALGLAHVGVLQWFEEHHIPVDYVAGTSMGGLVGGFYATGMNPADMRKMIEGIDWEQVLRDQTPYQDLSFLRKEDQRLYPNSLLFGLRKGVYLPAGLNAGHLIGLIIDRETAPYFGLHSFDELPIPFRCVASDLVSAKQFIFQDGSLAEALRATMSVPGIFTPVHDGQHVYVDGGLINNLPTDVVRQMGAEIVIAVHLEVAPVNAKSIQSLVDVLEQSVRSVISSSEVRGLANADAIVTVPLDNFSMRDFTKYEPLMRSGYEAAKGKQKLLDAFALSDTQWNDYVSQRNSRKRTTTPVPTFF
jgi:NTE family protein